MSHANGFQREAVPMPFAAKPYLEAFDRVVAARTVCERKRAEEEMAKLFPWLLAENECERLLGARRRGRAGPWFQHLLAMVALHPE